MLTSTAAPGTDTPADQQPRSRRGLSFGVWLPLIVGGALFVLHSTLFWGYIVDDAGISYAYSRSLAQGYGLVAQPGSPPVEGSSSFTWVVLLAPFFALDLFDPYLVPKFLSLALVLLTLGVLSRALTNYLGARMQSALLVLILLAANTSFVLWTTAGLENPLYALLTASLISVTARSFVLGDATRQRAVLAGTLAALAAMTRPDGIVLAAAYPLASLLGGAAPQERRGRGPLAVLTLTYALAFGLPFGAFVLFRLLYFGDLVPNTYHAKVGPARGDVAGAFAKVQDLFAGLISVQGQFATVGAFAILLLLLTTACLVAARRFGRSHYVLGLFVVLSASIYAALPQDVMREYRFATPFFLALYSYTVLLCATIMRSLPISLPRKRLLSFGVVALALALSVGIFTLRSNFYASHPYAPLDVVKRDSALKFNAYADGLGIQDGSVLLPDVGATLLYSRLRVYDLGMLTDRTIALTLPRDRPAFYNYVFDQIKPTFIRTHEIWAYLARFDDDPRFRRDYVPIGEALDQALLESGVRLYSGDYVRKEAVEGKDAALTQLQQAYKAQRPSSP